MKRKIIVMLLSTAVVIGNVPIVSCASEFDDEVVSADAVEESADNYTSDENEDNAQAAENLTEEIENETDSAADKENLYENDIDSVEGKGDLQEESISAEEKAENLAADDEMEFYENSAVMLDADPAGTSYDTATTIEINKNYTGYGNDSFFYKFIVKKAGTFTVTLSHDVTSVPYETQGYISIYDSSKERIARKFIRRTEASIKMPVSLSMGTYYFMVSPAYKQNFNFMISGDNESTDGSSTTGNSGTCIEHEPNDSFEDANQIDINKYYYASLDNNDYYKFTVKKAGTFKVIFNHVINPVPYDSPNWVINL